MGRKRSSDLVLRSCLVMGCLIVFLEAQGCAKKDIPIPTTEEAEDALVSDFVDEHEHAVARYIMKRKDPLISYLAINKDPLGSIAQDITELLYESRNRTRRQEYAEKLVGVIKPRDPLADEWDSMAKLDELIEAWNRDRTETIRMTGRSTDRFVYALTPYDGGTHWYAFDRATGDTYRLNREAGVWKKTSNVSSGKEE